MASEPAVDAPRRSLTRSYFENLYAGDPDPWRFRTSHYEKEKYEDTIRALEGRRFERGVEIGCSIGELTAHLAPECRSLLGVDISQQAVDGARARTHDLAGVTIERMTLPDEAPEGSFDLIVLSEVLYYFDPVDLARVADWVVGARAVGGVVLLVHWLGETGDYPMGGDEATGRFFEAVERRLTVDSAVRRAKYRLDRLS